MDDPEIRIILDQLNHLSRIEPSATSAKQAVENARARLRNLEVEPVRPLIFKGIKFSMMSIPMNLRIATLVLGGMALGAIIILLALPGNQGQIAFAQVIEKVRQTKSLSFKEMRRHEPGPGATEVHILVLPEGKIRIESHSWYGVGDFIARKEMSVNKETKTARISEPDRFSAEAERAKNLYDMVRNAGKEAQRLPDEVIDGRKAIVFKAILTGLDKKTKIPTKVWVDPKTKLPFRLGEIIKDENNKEVVQDMMYDITFDQPLDPSLFSLTPPEGYKVEIEGAAH
jgi:outer membrane lipoprotein-sorting protein